MFMHAPLRTVLPVKWAVGPHPDTVVHGAIPTVLQLVGAATGDPGALPSPRSLWII